MEGKPVIINGLRKFENPPSSLVIFLVVPFNKIVLFLRPHHCHNIFFSLFVRVIPETVIDKSPFLIFYRLY